MVATLPPWLGASVRFVVPGGVLLAAIASRRGVRCIRLSGKGEYGRVALTGVLLLTGGTGLLTAVQRRVPTGLSALLVATVPLFIVLFRALAGDRPTAVTTGGVLIGFLGVALLVVPGGFTHTAPLVPTLLVLVSAGCTAAGSFAGNRLRMPANSIVTAAWQMILGGAGMVACGLVAGEAGEIRLAGVSSGSLLAFAYLAVAGSLVAFTAYVWLVGHAPISQVATCTSVSPVIAILLGWCLLGERLSSTSLVAAALVIGSTAAVVAEENPRCTVRPGVPISDPTTTNA
jgi:drug/metabolite transporter (DMT)-like permease